VENIPNVKKLSSLGPTFLTKCNNLKKCNHDQGDCFASLFSHSSTGGLQLKLHGDCYECAAVSLTLSRSRVGNRSEVKAHELVRFVVLRSNWFYLLSKYVRTCATTTSPFAGTTFGGAVGLTTIFCHRFCTNVVNGRREQ